MGKRLFIGGLPYQYDDNLLSQLFAKIGTVVSASVIIDRATGRSKGFGFVEMSTEEEAQNAIKTLNSTEVDGRRIAVNEAHAMEARPQDNSSRDGRTYPVRRQSNRRGNNNRR